MPASTLAVIDHSEATPDRLGHPSGTESLPPLMRISLLSSSAGARNSLDQIAPEDQLLGHEAEILERLPGPKIPAHLSNSPRSVR